MQISGKSFIVTGGASGLGRAAAEAILEAQGRVVLLDVNAETGQETATSTRRARAVRASGRDE